MNSDLVRAFREEEIRVALNQMHPTKAPGSDCMSPIFFPEVLGCGRPVFIKLCQQNSEHRCNAKGFKRNLYLPYPKS